MSNLTPDNVLSELQPLFREALDEPELIVSRDSSGANTPSWDSFAHIELIEIIELHYKIRFGLGQLQDLKNVGDLVDLILEKLIQRNKSH